MLDRAQPRRRRRSATAIAERPQRPRSRAERLRIRQAGERERQRRLRARRKAGEERYVIVAPEIDVVEAILRSGRLSEADALNHALVERVLTDVIIEWSARWKPHT
jgi:hypothetical protein